MKKLMIAFAIVCAGVMAQAATANWDWKTSYSGKIYSSTDSSKTLASGTAYIFALTDGAQQSLLTAFENGSTWTTGSLSSKSVSAGKIAATSATDFSYGTGSDPISFFIAVADGDKIFISDSFNGNPDYSSYTSLSISANTASQRALQESKTFSEGGWYTNAVPEPTSGLLLLLGMAGLALRRRRV